MGDKEEIDNNLIKEDLANFQRRQKVKQMNRKTLEEYAVRKGKMEFWLVIGLLFAFLIGWLVSLAVVIGPVTSTYDADDKTIDMLGEKLCQESYGESGIAVYAKKNPHYGNYLGGTPEYDIEVVCQNHVIGIPVEEAW